MAWPTSRTSLLTCALLVVALALRVGEVQRVPYTPRFDALSYLTLASEIAHTGDYSTSRRPGAGAGGTRGPSAYFPPGFPYFLAAVDLIDGHRSAHGAVVQPARLSQAALGTAVAALIGLVALEACGPTVGLVALALAAFYPVLIELSAILAAENLMTALVLAAIYTILRARRSSRPLRWIAGSGALAGLATLTHLNAALVVPTLLAGALAARRSIASPAVLAAAFLATILPWTIRNADQLHRFVAVSDETGITLVGTYNPASAANQHVPYKWRFYAAIPGESRRLGPIGRLTELQLSGRLEHQAFHYIGDHPLSPFAVLFHNSLRLLELEGSIAWRASTEAEGLPGGTARIGVVSFWLLALLAVAGVFTAAARRVPRWIWLAPALLWLSIALVNAETPRFREPLDPFLILLAACALAAVRRPLRPRRPALLRRSPVA